MKIDDIVIFEDKYYNNPEFKAFDRHERKYLASMSDKAFVVRGFSGSFTHLQYRDDTMLVPISLLKVAGHKEQPKIEKARLRFKMRRYWAEQEIRLAKLKAEHILCNFFEQDKNVTIAILGEKTYAWLSTMNRFGQETRVTTKCSEDDHYSFDIAKCVVLCKLAKLPIPDFILR